MTRYTTIDLNYNDEKTAQTLEEISRIPRIAFYARKVHIMGSGQEVPLECLVPYLNQPGPISVEDNLKSISASSMSVEKEIVDVGDREIDFQLHYSSVAARLRRYPYSSVSEGRGIDVSKTQIVAPVASMKLLISII